MRPTISGFDAGVRGSRVLDMSMIAPALLVFRIPCAPSAEIPRSYCGDINAPVIAAIARGYA
jgi:hypothetical protein